MNMIIPVTFLAVFPGCTIIELVLHAAVHTRTCENKNSAPLPGHCAGPLIFRRAITADPVDNPVSTNLESAADRPLQANLMPLLASA